MELPKNRCWISRLGAWQKGLMSRSSVGIQEPTGGGGKPWEWMAETQWSRPVWESEPRAQRGLRLSPLLAFSRRNIRFHKNVVDHFSSLCVGGTGKTQLEMPFRSRLHSALFCSSFLRVPSFRPDPASCLINQYQGGQLVYFFLPFHFLEFCWSLSYSFSFPIKLLKDTMEMLISCISIKPVFEPIMFKKRIELKCWRKTPQEPNYHIRPTKRCQRDWRSRSNEPLRCYSGSRALGTVAVERPALLEP